MMQQLADGIFNELYESCPKFVALVIDQRTLDEHCTTVDVPRSGFLRARQTDICGRTKAVGVPIEPHMIKHYEPCSEILAVDV